jgi:PilZ domain
MELKSRRMVPRYRWAISVRLTDVLSGTEIDGQTKDLSLFGCSVIALHLFPTGTSVRFRLCHGDAYVTGLARVAHVSPQLGMGFAFSNIEAADERILGGWIADLTESSDQRGAREPNGLYAPAELPSPAPARRSRHLYIHMLVTLAWRPEDQTLISEETEPVVVNAHGGLIRVDSVPPLGQKVTLHNIRANQTEEAVVVFVGKAGAKDGKVIVGVEFIKQNASFWCINSPLQNWSSSHPDAKE